jgi:hypothetical protein
MTEAITAFIKAQANLGAALKKSSNPFLKNKYADLASLQEAIFPVFNAEGFSVTQECGADDIGKFVETKFTHTTNHVFSSRVYLEYKQGDMQSLGGAITYARRYGLSSLSGVPELDDDGNSAVGHNRMQIKQDIKENRINHKDRLALERGDKLEQLAKTATEEQMVKFGPEARVVIDQIKIFKPERAAEIEVAWNNREQELGIE